MALQRPLESVLDDDLISALAGIAGQARRIEADLVAHIAEVDLRRLYARYACPSMFVYATHVLNLAEGEAFRRIRVARASRRHPILLEMLADGRLHVSGIALLVPFLTPQNRDQLLSLAVHKTKREIEKLIAELNPRPDAPSVMRKLPERPAAPTCGESPAATSVQLVPGTPLESPAWARFSPPSRLRAGPRRRAALAGAVQDPVHRWCGPPRRPRPPRAMSPRRPVGRYTSARHIDRRKRARMSDSRGETPSTVPGKST
jgi:hypothetical protein